MLNKKDKPAFTSTPSKGLNVFSEGTELTGDLASKGDIRIDGKVDGTVKTNSKFVLGESGKVTGNVSAESADISGKVNGNIQVNGTLYIKSNGVINGDIATGKLVVESGGQFNGQCKMGGSTIPLKSPLSEKTAKEGNA